MLKPDGFKVNKGKGSDGKGDTRKYTEATLGNGDLRLLVTLPEGEDINEWLAVHVADFYNQINMLWGAIAELCKGPECSIMSAGPKYEYHWADGKEIKKAIKVSANEYAGYLFEWVKKQIDDQTIFPVKSLLVLNLLEVRMLTTILASGAFPPNYLDKVKHIFKRLFRVYAHIYHAHFQHVVTLGIEVHVNTSFKHFIFFVLEFDLIDKKELAPLSEYIDSLCK